MAEQGPLSNQMLGGKYLLGELLGQGGFGAVYQARHTLLNRQQAVKILLEQHFTSPKFRERFIREAQTLAALDQPNIVHVDDFGFDGSRAYLVMPYIGGGNLHSILRRRGPLPLEGATRYLEQICAALDYAHARSVAHLDLKPLNLLVHEDGRLLLSDFGLAHLMEQGAIEGSTSLQFGTPTYMAPEHLQGQPERRSDIYALGIILYQMLAGRVPFEGSNAAAIMLKHLTEPPPPLRNFRPDLPALDGVLAKALAKQASERYQTTGELLTGFKAALKGRASQPVARIAVAPQHAPQTQYGPVARSAKPRIAPSHHLNEREAALPAVRGVAARSALPTAHQMVPARTNRFFSLKRAGRFWREVPAARWVSYVDLALMVVMTISVWLQEPRARTLAFAVGVAGVSVSMLIVGLGTQSKGIARAAAIPWAFLWSSGSLGILQALGVTFAASSLPLFSISLLVIFVAALLFHIVLFYGATARAS